MVALETSRLRTLLDKGVDYWGTDWYQTPVYIIAQSENETNPRYAIIYNWSTPSDENPYSQPFLQPAQGVVFTNWLLSIERGHWLALPPGNGECAEASAQAPSDAAFTDDAPEASADDCYVIVPGGIVLTGTFLVFGVLSAAEEHTGIRFRSVDVPAGAIIDRAFVRFVAAGSSSSTPCATLIYGERDVTPAAWSTYADFFARFGGARTNENVSWNAPAFTAGVSYDTPDVTDVIQEIIDLGAWASGNDLAMFFMNNQSTDGVFRTPASYDNPTYNPPELHIAYRGVLHGQEATCEQECYVVCKNNVAQLTHIYTHRVAAFGPNLLGEALPYALLPNVPQANDAVYFGIDTTTTNSGPFSSLVFDLSVAGAGYTAIWEYWNGAWVALTPRDNTFDARPLDILGVRSIHWIPQSDWVTTTVNAVTGYWVRLRVTVNGTVEPEQQNRNVYTVVWPYVETSDTSGDMPALTQIRIANESFNEGTPLPRLPIDRVLVGLRSMARGESFTAYLNLADEQNPSGITVGVEATDSAFATDAGTPSGRCITYAPGAMRALAGEAYIVIGDEIVQQFYGAYHAFLRVQQTAGSAGDISAQLNIAPGSTLADSSNYWESVIKYTYDTNEFNWIDFGELTIFPGRIPQERSLDDITISILLSTTNAAAVLQLYDLVLLPVDEWAGDSKRLTDDADTLTVERTLELDAISSPKDAPLALLRDDASGNAIGVYNLKTNELPLLQANAQQRLWFMFEEDTGGTLRAPFHSSASIQLLKVDRFLSFRGAR
jgi:hypothetical protein